MIVSGVSKDGFHFLGFDLLDMLDMLDKSVEDDGMFSLEKNER